MQNSDEGKKISHKHRGRSRARRAAKHSTRSLLLSVSRCPEEKASLSRETRHGHIRTSQPHIRSKKRCESQNSLTRKKYLLAAERKFMSKRFLSSIASISP